MKHWLKRGLAVAALASGALIATAGMASASTGSPLPVDPEAILTQTQEANNTNDTTQEAKPNTETHQVNVYAPIAVLSHGSNNGKVDQSNEADTTVVAVNENDTEQSIDQDQTGGDDQGGCGKCGSEGGSSQEQTAENNNPTTQTANPTVTTDQSNVYAPVAVLTKDSNNGKVEQSNDSETKVVAVNENDTEQSIDQDQTAGEDRGGCGKCGSEGGSQTQTAENNNPTTQTANPTVTTDQSNELGSDQASTGSLTGSKGNEYGHGRGHESDGVDQSNEAETTVIAENENGTEQTIDQDQTAGDSQGSCDKCGSEGGSQTQTAENNNPTTQTANPIVTTDQSNELGSNEGPAESKDNGYGNERGGVDQSNEAETTVIAENENGTEQTIDQDQTAGSRDDRDHKDKDDRDHKDKDDRDHKDKDDRDHKDKDDRDHKDKDDRDHKDKDDRDHKDKDDRDHKDKDDRDHKDKGDRDHKDKDDRDHNDRSRCAPKGGRSQSQVAGNNNTTNQEAKPSAVTTQSNSAYRGNDIDQANRARTKALAANRNGTGQSIDQSQHLSS